MADGPTPKWIDVVGVLWIGWGTVSILSDLVVLVVMLTAFGSASAAAVEMVVRAGFPEEFARIYVAVLPVLMVIALLVSCVEVALGIGIYRRASWGWWLGIVFGPLNLISFPLGTILGAATLFVLIHPGLRRHFGGAQ